MNRHNEIEEATNPIEIDYSRRPETEGSIRGSETPPLGTPPLGTPPLNATPPLSGTPPLSDVSERYSPINFFGEQKLSDEKYDQLTLEEWREAYEQEQSESKSSEQSMRKIENLITVLQKFPFKDLSDKERNQIFFRIKEEGSIAYINNQVKQGVDNLVDLCWYLRDLINSEEARLCPSALVFAAHKQLYRWIQRQVGLKLEDATHNVGKVISSDQLSQEVLLKLSLCSSRDQKTFFEKYSFDMSKDKIVDSISALILQFEFSEEPLEKKYLPLLKLLEHRLKPGSVVLGGSEKDPVHLFENYISKAKAQKANPQSREERNYLFNPGPVVPSGLDVLREDKAERRKEEQRKAQQKRKEEITQLSTDLSIFTCADSGMKGSLQFSEEERMDLVEDSSPTDDQASVSQDSSTGEDCSQAPEKSSEETGKKASDCRSDFAEGEVSEASSEEEKLEGRLEKEKQGCVFM